MPCNISVIIPTIKGREDYLAQCCVAYSAHTENYELIVIPDRPGCGQAWVEGAEKAQGDYIHFSADDLQPHAGWAGAAMEVVRRGFLPAPRILNTDGSLQSCGEWGQEIPTGKATLFTRIPFLSREQWAGLAPVVTDFLRQSHYYTDNIISWAARQQGIETGVHRDYLFTHHLAPADREIRPGSRMQEDAERFMDLERARSGRNVVAINDYGFIYA